MIIWDFIVNGTRWARTICKFHPRFAASNSGHTGSSVVPHPYEYHDNLFWKGILQYQEIMVQYYISE